jgi:outer membrane protein W
MGSANGDLNTFVKDRNFDGFLYELSYFVNDEIAVGGCIGWNDFTKKLDRTNYTLDNGSVVSSVQTRYFQTVPLMATLDYYFENESIFTPYVGIASGLYFVRYEKWWGAVEDSHNSTNFGFRPQLGLNIELGDGAGINISAKYNYGIYKYNEINNFSYIEGNIGLYFNY